MMLFRSLVSLSLAVALLVPVTTAEAAKGKKKGHALHGVVTAVQSSEGDKDAGTLTVKSQPHKKKGAAAASTAEATEKTFTITKDTKFVKVTGKKKDKKEEAASFADVKQGTHVVVMADKDGKAEKVSFHEGKKKAKKNK